MTPKAADGIASIDDAIPNNAEHGEDASGPRVLPHPKAGTRMKAGLRGIRSGPFTHNGMQENPVGLPFLAAPVPEPGRTGRRDAARHDDPDL